MQDVQSAPSSMAKTSLILGICAIIPFVGWALGLAAIILGIIDLVKIKNNETSPAGKKFDILGIIFGVVFPWIFSMIIIVAVWGAAFAAMSGALNY